MGGVNGRENLCPVDPQFGHDRIEHPAARPTKGLPSISSRSLGCANIYVAFRRSWQKP
jgi:hypothetical protein